MTDWRSHLDPEDERAPAPTPEHLELRARSGAESAQRYSDVLLHRVLCVLPTTSFGSVAVLDAWTEGEWAVAVVFRQLGVDRPTATGCGEIASGCSHSPEGPKVASRHPSRG